LSQLHCYAFHLIPLKETSNDVLLDIAIRGDLYDFTESEIKRLNDILAEDNTNNNSKLNNNLPNIFSRMTVSQLDIWRSLNSDLVNRIIFMENYFSKKFSTHIDYEEKILLAQEETISIHHLEKRHSNLREMHEFTKDLPKIYYHLRKDVLTELLKTAFVIHSPDLTLFKVYLEEFYTSKPDSIFTALDFVQNDSITQLSEEQMVEYYLHLSLKTAKNPSAFSTYFE
jgi:hypothetical protein